MKSRRGVGGDPSLAKREPSGDLRQRVAGLLILERRIRSATRPLEGVTRPGRQDATSSPGIARRGSHEELTRVTIVAHGVRTLGLQDPLFSF